MRDTWEDSHLDPGQTREEFKPWGDKDGDGWTNLEEFLNKTDAGTGDDPMDGEADSHVEGVL